LHTIAAVAARTTSEVLGERTVQLGARGFAALLALGRRLGGERVGALEDCRQVSGSVERFLIARGERVLRVPTKLMAETRRGVVTARSFRDVRAKMARSPLTSHLGARSWAPRAELTTSSSEPVQPVASSLTA
jgi:hypothetical protein